jgi:GlcNAc-P-P-Und epimerase
MNNAPIKTLLTGGTGFLSKEMLSGLQSIGCEVTTLGRTEIADIGVDISDDFQLEHSFDWVIHAAGKVHTVPKNKHEEDDFFRINERGTKNLCLALEKVGIPTFMIFISTVAVYGTSPVSYIDEQYPTNADTPYGISKLNAEQYLREWCTSNGVKLGVLRLPLIAGKNPPGNLGQMIEAMRTRKYLSINNGRALRSCVLTSDLPSVFLSLLAQPGVYNLKHLPDPSFSDFEQSIQNVYKDARSIGNIPIWIANILALVGGVIPGFPFNKNRLAKMTEDFTISDEKARKILSWNGSWDPRKIPL